MNFKRIEVVFVIAFIGLNLFLFALYRNNTTALSSAASSTQTEAIEALLESNQITFEGELSREHQEGYYLSGEQSNWNAALGNLRNASNNQDLFTRGITIASDELTNQLSNRQIINADELGEGIEAFLALPNLVPYGNEYTYLEKLSNYSDESNIAIAGQSYEGIPFNDDTSQIQLTLSENSEDETYTIDSYTVTHLASIETLREKMELASEREAVTTLYTNNRLSRDSEILWTQLAYSRIMTIRSKNIYVPVWFIAIQTNDSTSQIENVNAISNSVISSSPITIVES